MIEEVAKVTCSKKEAGLAVEATFAAIQKALKKGDAVTLVGFGTFGVSKRKARSEKIRLRDLQNYKNTLVIGRIECR